jgi:hypothetical protein
MHRLTRNEVRRIAANIAKLPGLLKRSAYPDRGLVAATATAAIVVAATTASIVVVTATAAIAVATATAAATAETKPK